MWPQAAVNLPAATAVSLRHLTTGSREFRARLKRSRSSAGSPTPAHRSLSRSNLLPPPLDINHDTRHILYITTVIKQTAERNRRASEPANSESIRSNTAANARTEALYTNTALHAWNLVIAQLDKMFSSMNDEELIREVAPGT